MSNQDTHQVTNQPPLLQNYNLFGSDRALQSAIVREGAAWAVAELEDYGERCGKAETIQWGFQANEYPPRLRTHDPRGYRIDLVEYHPAYHQLMSMAINQGISSRTWNEPRAGAHVARAALVYMQVQIEAGHVCPLTMSFAAVPTLRKQPALAAVWEPLLTTREYDPRNCPASEKHGITVGMGMTEKQGGSDVRSNTTHATPMDGQNGVYTLTGHKYFFSAPMCDAFLVLAQAPGGLTCFLMPRWRSDGAKNAIEIQQLKDKVGNVANASSEVEFRGAEAYLIGEEGRGVASIIDMVALTRFDCMVSSSAIMRQAVVQAMHHCTYRQAFGKPLIDHPLMQNVLADLALESEAALAMSMRAARALDNINDESEALLFRLLAPLGKYWMCKRTPGHTYEAMECLGGRGAIQDSIMPRLYREAPINAIWEGSGNIQCLDVFRAIQKQPKSLEAFVEHLATSKSLNSDYDKHFATVQDRIRKLITSDPIAQESEARSFVETLVLAFQANTLLQAGDEAVSEVFCRSRLNNQHGGLYGTLPHSNALAALCERAGIGNHEEQRAKT